MRRSFPCLLLLRKPRRAKLLRARERARLAFSSSVVSILWDVCPEHQRQNAFYDSDSPAWNICITRLFCSLWLPQSTGPYFTPTGESCFHRIICLLLGKWRQSWENWRITPDVSASSFHGYFYVAKVMVYQTEEGSGLLSSQQKLETNNPATEASEKTLTPAGLQGDAAFCGNQPLSCPELTWSSV